MLFRETVAVYCENHTEHTKTLCGQNVGFSYANAGGTYSNHWALTGKYCLGKQSLFMVRTIWNTQIHSVGKIQSFDVLKRVAHIETSVVLKG
jgi:hypothetical protein